MRLREFIGNTRNRFKTAALTASNLLWRSALDRSESVRLLEDGLVYQKQPTPVSLPELAPVNGLTIYHPATTRTFEASYVWKMQPNGNIKTLKVCRSGNALINNKLLVNLDYRATAGLLESPLKIKHTQYPIVIAPWPHFWSGYYDYVIFVVAKLCRIEVALGKDVWKNAKICYPLLNTGFEKQFLEKFGIDPSAVIDTSKNWTTEVRTECLILGNNQRSFCPSPEDLFLLRNKFGSSQASSNGKQGRKLYLPRRGKRKVANNTEVQEIMKSYGFEIIEDIARTVDEQIELFKSAAIIVSPHGAALTNLIWCDPGTKVLEFFHEGYTPDYYYYFSKVLNLEYAYMIDKDSGKRKHHWSNTSQDIQVDIDALRNQLNSMLTSTSVL